MRYTYQINNYITLRKGNIAKITELHSDVLKLVSLDNINILTSYDDVLPLNISKEVLSKAGLIMIKEKIQPLHIEYSYEIDVNHMFHYLRAVEYKKNTIWSIGSFSIKYFHMLQNYLKFFDPNFELVIN